jgi:hypothetical protein
MEGGIGYASVEKKVGEQRLSEKLRRRPRIRKRGTEKRIVSMMR